MATNEIERVALTADQFRALPLDAKRDILADLEPAEMAHLLYDWYGFWARPAQQIPSGDWSTWVVLAGRGFGKTRTGAEYVRYMVEHRRARRIALIARTKADIRDVMVEGESGILAISPPSFKPLYEVSKRRLTWPNGATATLFSADEPNQLRGPQHDLGWCDELASWREHEAWDNFQMGLRLGTNPLAVVTTTPKRVKLLRDILHLPGTIVTGGSTYENRENLAATFFRRIIAPYEGTRLGRQEILAIVEDDNPDALWNYDRTIEPYRRTQPSVLKRIVVAVDPEATSGDESAETGIIVAGRGLDNHLYVLADYSLRGTPHQWGAAVRRAYNAFQADMIVGEVNNGGDMVEHVIVQPGAMPVPFKAVKASRGKLTRAEPISAIYEKGWAHHCGIFPELESQMCQWMPGEPSPDRLDALVWAGTELMFHGGLWSGTPEAADPPDYTRGMRIPGVDERAPLPFR